MEPFRDFRPQGDDGSVEDRDWPSELRGLIARGDSAALVHLLARGSWPDDCLQMIGDGLLAALSEPAVGAEAMALRCAALLRSRGWDGDEQLADTLLAACSAVRPLRPLAVDLEELSMVLEGDPVLGGGAINLTTGEVWPQAAIDYAMETGEFDENDLEDVDRWMWVGCEGSRPGYRDMEQFIADLDDPDLTDRLSRAISGRGAFRRFKDCLAQRPDLLNRWYAFSGDRQRGRARAWLAAQRYTATPPAPRR